MVQWLRLRAHNAGGLGSIPGQGTRSRMLQLEDPAGHNEDPHVATKIPRATTKTRRNVHIYVQLNHSAVYLKLTQHC